MDTKLTNYEIRGYKKQNGRISFHLRSHILFTTNTSFSIEVYLKTIRGYLKLPGKSEIEFDSVSISVNSACKFNDEILAYELCASVVSNLKDIQPCVATLRFDYLLVIHGAEFNEKIEQHAFIKRMF